MRPNTDRFISLIFDAKNEIRISNENKIPMTEERDSYFINSMDACFESREDAVEIFAYVVEQQKILMELAGDEGLENSGDKENISLCGAYMMFFMNTNLDFDDPIFEGVQIFPEDEDDDDYGYGDSIKL